MPLHRGFRPIGAGTATPMARARGISGVRSNGAAARGVAGGRTGRRRGGPTSGCRVGAGLILQGRSANRGLDLVVLPYCRRRGRTHSEGVQETPSIANRGV